MLGGCILSCPATLGGQLPAQAPGVPRNPIQLVLYLVEPLRDRAQPALEALEVTRRGQVERGHRSVLGLQRLLASPEGGGHGVLEHMAVEQGLGELADRLLAARPQAVLVVLEIAFEAHRRQIRDSALPLGDRGS